MQSATTTASTTATATATPVSPDQTTRPALTTGAATTGSVIEKESARPQRLHTWFNLIPVAEYEEKAPEQLLFLDSFVVVAADGDDYKVLFEGRHEMTVVVHIGIIFVWYGEHLLQPDRPFPDLYKTLYPTRYISSKPTVFSNTHVMDFVENGSDNLHFRIVHLWNHSKLYDHVVTDDRITLKQDTRFNYGACSLNPFIRMMSKVIPEFELTHDYVYHGPCLAVVNATGRGAPPFHALVSLTPEGKNRTRVYVTMALSPATFPSPMEKMYQRFFPQSHLCDLLCGVMANYIKNEFDVDAIVWKNRKWLREPRLIASERHLYDVIRWGESFYPADHQYPDESATAEKDKQWRPMDDVKYLLRGRAKAYSIAGVDMVAYLDSGGDVRVFDAYCPHQGAHLGHDAGGKIVNDCLRCPFHGFHFNRDGKCLGQNPDNKDRFLSGLELTEIQHRVSGGTVEVLV
jgi:nitrite reductase/ring-hydroxylating ferredoxin subunit